MAYDRWVSAWRQGIRACPEPASVTCLSTGKTLEVSRGGKALLGRVWADQTEDRTLAERPEVAATMELLRNGVLDGAHGRSRFRRPDGPSTEVEGSVWAIRTTGGPDLALWVAHTGPGVNESTWEQVVDPAQPWSDRLAPSGRAVNVVLDDRWVFAEVNDDARPALARAVSENLGVPVREVIHPADLVGLLVAFARATTRARVTTWLRLWRGANAWESCSAVVTTRRTAAGTLFSLDLRPAHSTEPDRRIAELEFHLEQIRVELDAARIVESPPGAVDISVELADLSERQREVVLRLARGQRVPKIAEEMYVSQSTVRNHLSGAFKTLGIHSQQELLGRLWRS